MKKINIYTRKDWSSKIKENQKGGENNMGPQQTKNENFNYNDAFNTIGATLLVTGLCFTALAVGGAVIAPPLTVGVAIGAVAIGVIALGEEATKFFNSDQKSR